MRTTEKINEIELQRGSVDRGSWHDQYRESPYVYVGGLDFELTEGDLRAVFSQYGELKEINIIHDQETGKSRGYAFLGYEDQKSTILAVDNLNGIELAGRNIRVDHVERYKSKEDSKREKDERRSRFSRGQDQSPLVFKTATGESITMTQSNRKELSGATGRGPSRDCSIKRERSPEYYRSRR